MWCLGVYVDGLTPPTNTDATERRSAEVASRGHRRIGSHKILAVATVSVAWRRAIRVDRPGVLRANYCWIGDWDSASPSKWIANGAKRQFESWYRTQAGTNQVGQGRANSVLSFTLASGLASLGAGI